MHLHGLFLASLAFLIGASPALVLDVKTLTVEERAATCNNQGLQYAEYARYYQDKCGAPEAEHGYFHPVFYKTGEENHDYYISYQNVTEQLGGFDYCADCGSGVRYYNNDNPTDVYCIVINHRGYFHAPSTGTYTFTASHAGDLILVWLGPVAYSGWKRGNAVIDLARRTRPNIATATFGLKRGEYMPLRIMWTNFYGAARFQLGITGPGGKVLAETELYGSESLAQYGCGADLQKAPRYEEFAAET